MKVLVMSIKPKYSRLIFRGDKRYELRRSPVKVSAGDLIVVYESAPQMAVVGAFTVGCVQRGCVNLLWNQFGAEFGVSNVEYRSYFEGADTAHAIEVGSLVQVDPVPLKELRRRVSGFRPPQSYMFWRDALGLLLGRAADEILSAV